MMDTCETLSLTVLVGLPASGKSTLAKKICEMNPELVLIGSDQIRAELYGDEGIQGSGKEVFDLVYKRIHDALVEDKSVVYDATNLFKKSRRSVLKCIPEGKDVLVKFLVCRTPLQKCLERNAARSRVVPEEIIVRMAERMCYPTRDEYDHSIVVMY